MAKQPRTRMPKVWVVGGGKGGTGKTFVTSCLGIYLAERRKKDVILLDADFGGANLHSVFGIKQPKRSVNAFFEFKKNEVNLSEKLKTGIKNALDALKVKADKKALKAPKPHARKKK